MKEALKSIVIGVLDIFMKLAVLPGRERDFYIDDLLVPIQSIIVMIGRIGLAP